ncbi:MAG: replication protein A [Gammaproteobacteria bacterium]|nr:replication protein A [Gammaproteobacteria bacterium]
MTVADPYNRPARRNHRPAGVDHWDNIRFRRQKFDRMPGVTKTLEAGYMKIARRYSYVQANRALIDAEKTLIRGDLNLAWDDEQVVRWCKKRADEVAHIVATFSCEASQVMQVLKILALYDLEFPDRQVDLFGYGPALRRCSCEQWWRRQVRVLQAREVEEMARSWRLVHDKGQIYCSHNTVNRRRAQKVRNAKLLSQLNATNQVGQEYLLSELADLQVSNPKIRRSELMVRMRGFEDLAASQGRVGEFYTITCPSKYHSTNKGGIPNDKWNGSTVREANDYLVGLWSRVRSALARRGIDVYGFRVAEPHSDGCPHWHLLLFVVPSSVLACRSIVESYAMAEDGTEPGARDNRFKAVSIDPARGSATGYIAKYISKNIDGHGVHDDLYGHEAKSSAVRIEAWAACHGIRQFQQIGGPSVTVWRELRRLSEPDSPAPGMIEQCRQAADSANWAAFCVLMGSGRGQALQIARAADIDQATGECLSPVYNRYGEPAVDRIVGLIGDFETVLTRIWTWTVERLTTAVKKVKTKVVPGWSLVPGWVCESGPPGPHLEFCQ